MVSLTSGAIDRINAGDSIKDPILKVVGYKNVPGSNAGQNRYRLLLSDGVKSHSFAMLATQLNHLVETGKLLNGSIIRLKKFVCNNVQKDKYVVIVLDVDIVGFEQQTPAQGRQPLNQVEDNSSVQSTASSLPDRNVASTPPRCINSPFASASPGTPGGRVFSIQSLNPYQSRWTIRARVSQKGTIRTWQRSGREGKLFSFTLLDSTGEIRATAFNAEVDKFYDQIEVNKVYYISKASLKPANKQFNTTNNDYEMSLNSDTQIVPCEDGEDVSVPSFSFNFVPIGKLDGYQPGDFVDVVGVVHESGDVSTITIRSSQREVQKREVGLVDDSGCLVRLTLWGQEAVDFDGTNHPALVVKSAKLSDFNGRSLSTTTQSSVMIAPTSIPEANRLKGWYENGGGSTFNFEMYRGEIMGEVGGEGFSGTLGSRDWNPLSDLEAPGVGGQAKPDFFTCKAVVTFLKKENFMYQACTTEGCQKKVLDLGNGLYRCEKCNRETPNYKWRLLLSVKISDMTGEHWITCFQNTAEVILGRNAEELGAIKESKDENQMDNVFVNAIFKSWIFRLRAKVDTFNDESRLRVVAIEAKPVSFADYGRQLQKQIEAIIPTLPAELTMDDAMD
ncbi:Replication protein A 70 kDa DNA-binding subunit [Echinococcus granulosus]|nr:Replication protein A 70 kDa DNA-binding subunit [Echinococcus granulosus]